MLVIKIREPRSTRGDEIRKENVIPTGNPALVNPIKRGIEEQEQKGVTVPKSAAKIFADKPRNLDKTVSYTHLTLPTKLEV
mgnify:CR=1 FL=1